MRYRSTRLRRFVLGICGATLLAIGRPGAAFGAEPSDRPSDGPSVEQIGKKIAELEPLVLSAAEASQATAAYQEQYRRRLREAGARSTAAWRQISSRDAWTQFRDAKLAALRDSLGDFVRSGDRPLSLRTTGTFTGDGFRIRKILYQNGLGLWISANLYQPATPSESMPGIVISHAHHTPKTHGELQDMGMMWARAGCLVVVPDHLGHGERRQHPYHGEQDFPRPFPVSRQDYQFRYDNGIQLHLAGSSLIGQLAGDLSRAIDVLEQQPGLDRRRVLLLGAVAGGGDPCAVAAALDARFTAAAPFNFGGPQPETRFPLPDDAESAFNYTGSGSWESTRNLYRSAADGFLPWVIVGGVAPRPLVYAHEFAWDRERDPVWKRLQTIYGFSDSGDHLAFTLGRGSVKGKAPESTHCTHIGPVHRRLMHAAFHRWFDMPDLSDREYSQRVSSDELRCWTPELVAELKPRTMRSALLAALDARQTASGYEASGAAAVPAARDKTPQAARQAARERWARKLGDIQPATAPRVVASRDETIELPGGAVRVERLTLEVDQDIVLPILLLRGRVGAEASKSPPPVVVAVAQAGKAAFLKQRGDQIADLVRRGVVVCLPDLRGIGEVAAGGGRDRSSAATSYSSSELMLGGTLVGARLRDLRSILRHLRTRTDLDGRRVAIWGDSFTPPTPDDRPSTTPHSVDGRPAECEPLGGLLALFAALYEDDVRAVTLRGGLVSFRSALQAPNVLVPHDCVVPGALALGDLPALSPVLGAAAIRAEQWVDGLNRPANDDEVRRLWPSATGVEKPQAAWLAERLNVGA